MRQARTVTPRGYVRRRWYVTLPDGRVVITWAATRLAARTKCLVRRGVRPVKIEPAPSAANMLIRSALEEDPSDG